LNRHREQTVMASIVEPDPAQALTQERDGGRETRDYSTVDVVIRLGLIGLLINWSLPFVTVALWSAILVVALYPIFDWLSRSLRSLRLAASLITLLCLAVVIGPVTLGWGLLSSAAPSS
jgi:predicted PurR-regulated permease PerM